ncbi:MAG: ATP-binding protein [Thermoprotei archaeon]|nr:MAG: ATP-binding protein [Thermoprotei archaeon]
MVNKKVYEQISREIEKINERLKDTKHKVVILSVKGGVGKSFITANLAVALARSNKKVGVFDVDVHGPSIPRALGVVNKSIIRGIDGFLPVKGPLGIKIISIGLMLPGEESAVIWRGPLKAAYMRQVLANVSWGELDYLLLDMPPGTGDEQITIAQLIKGIDGILLVTNPSVLSEKVALKAKEFASKLKLEILGVIENMSHFKCSDGKVYYLFGKGGGRRLSEEVNAPLIASVPIEPYVAETMDSGEPLLIKYPESEASKEIEKIARYIIKRLEG